MKRSPVVVVAIAIAGGHQILDAEADQRTGRVVEHLVRPSVGQHDST